jgi:hypothetical protein
MTFTLTLELSDECSSKALAVALNKVAMRIQEREYVENVADSGESIARAIVDSEGNEGLWVIEQKSVEHSSAM